MNDFYKPRWEMFFSRLEASITNKTELDMTKFNDEVSKWEWNWVNQRKDYALTPVGNPVNVAVEMHQKYRKSMGILHQ
mgnify:FL=1